VSYAGPVYHRLRSPTQPIALDAVMIQRGQLCGGPAWGSSIPSVKAYDGPLPGGASGIEFTTTVPPTPGSPPGLVKWYKGSPGVYASTTDLVCIAVNVRRSVP
jgi:hypothetical protein